MYLESFDPGWLCARLSESWRSAALADVVIVVGTGTHRSKLRAHQCVLQQSPVLRELFERPEVRYSDKITLIWDGYEKKSVLSLLKFLYTGEVGLDRSSRVYTEFNKLCTLLRLRPAVKEDDGQRQSGGSSSDEHEYSCGKCSQSFSSASKRNLHIKASHRSIKRAEQAMAEEEEEEVEECGPEAPLQVEPEQASEGNREALEETINASTTTIVSENDTVPIKVEEEEEETIEAIASTLEAITSQESVQKTFSQEEAEEESSIKTEPASAIPDPCFGTDFSPLPEPDPPADSFQMPTTFDFPEEEIKRLARPSSKSFTAFRRGSVELLSPTDSSTGYALPAPSSSRPPAAEPTQRTVAPIEPVKKMASPDSSSIRPPIKKETLPDKDKSKQMSKKPAKKASPSEVTTKSLLEDLFGSTHDKEPEDKKKPNADGILQKAATVPSSNTLLTSHPGFQNELEAKRKRMLKALKSESKASQDYGPADWISGERKRKREHKGSSAAIRKFRQQVSSNEASRAKEKQFWKGDEKDSKWLVGDSDEDEDVWEPSEDSSEEERQKKRKKRQSRQSFSQVKYNESEEEEELPEPLKNRPATLSEESEDESTALSSSRKSRFLEKLEKSNLAWMERGNGKKVTVTVQNMPKDIIAELGVYRLKMMDSSSDDDSRSLAEESHRAADDDSADQDSSRRDHKRRKKKKKRRRRESSERSDSPHQHLFKRSHSVSHTKDSSGTEPPQWKRSHSVLGSEQAKRKEESRKQHQNRMEKLLELQRKKMASTSGSSAANSGVGRFSPKKSFSDLLVASASAAASASSASIKYSYGLSSEKSSMDVHQKEKSIMKMSFKIKKPLSSSKGTIDSTPASTGSSSAAAAAGTKTAAGLHHTKGSSADDKHKKPHKPKFRILSESESE